MEIQPLITGEVKTRHWFRWATVQVISLRGSGVHLHPAYSSFGIGSFFRLPTQQHNPPPSLMLSLLPPSDVGNSGPQIICRGPHLRVVNLIPVCCIVSFSMRCDILKFWEAGYKSLWGNSVLPITVEPDQRTLSVDGERMHSRVYESGWLGLSVVA